MMPKSSPVKYADASIDSGRMPTGFAASSERDPNEVMETDDDTFQLISVREVLQEVITRMSHYQFEMVPHPLGKVAGFKVYHDTVLALPGVQSPAGWHYLGEVKSKEVQATFVASFKMCIQELANKPRPEAEKKVLQSIYTAVVDRPRDKNSTVYHTALGLAVEDSKRIRSLMGNSGAHAFVPRLDWFDEDLQKYDPLELLTILPPAEKLMFAIVFGKMLAGRPGASLATSEGSLKYNMRAVVHLIDPIGGVGKSTLLNNSNEGEGYLMQGLKTCGYICDIVDPNMDKFSSPWVLADYARLDDAKPKDLKDVLTSGTLKSVATNGDVFVNLKGIQGAEQKVDATVFLASNLDNVPWLLRSMDDAQRARHQPLRCYTSEELKIMYKDEWQDYRIPSYWGKVAERFDTTVQVLSLRLMRRCLDIFLDHIGAEEQGKTLVQNPTKYKLERVMNELRSQFRSDVDLTHRSELVSGLARLTAVAAVVNPQLKERILAKLDDVTLSPPMLLTLLGIWVNEGSKLPSYCQEMSLPSLNPSVAAVIKKRFNDLQEVVAVQDADKSFSVLVKILRTKKHNIPYASGRAGDVDLEQYTGAFSQRIGTIRLMIAELESKPLIDDLPEYVYEAAMKIATQLK